MSVTCLLDICILHITISWSPAGATYCAAQTQNPVLLGTSCTVQSFCSKAADLDRLGETWWTYWVWSVRMLPLTCFESIHRIAGWEVHKGSGNFPKGWIDWSWSTCARISSRANTSCSFRRPSLVSEDQEDQDAFPLRRRVLANRLKCDGGGRCMTSMAIQVAEVMQ